MCDSVPAPGAFALSSRELSSYREHGYLIRRRVFSESELQLLRVAVESAVASVGDKASAPAGGGKSYFLDGKRFVDVGKMTVQFEQGTGNSSEQGTASHPDQGSDTIRVIEPVHQLDQSLDEVIRDPRIIDPVCTILGTDALALWTNKLNLKRGGSGSGFGWHQDSPYWVHDSDHVDLLPNVYLAFDDATEANGCLRVIDRSHLQGCLPGYDDGTQLGGFFTDPNHFSEADQVLLEVPAGSLVFFDPHCIHGSRPNATDLPRRALVTTYQPAGFPMLKTGEVVNVTKAPLKDPPTTTTTTMTMLGPGPMAKNSTAAMKEAAQND